MADARPQAISKAQRDARQRRATQVARRLGFVGRVEYRHVFSQAGGAQFGLAAAPKDDLLIVYAEAFERDAAPDDFSLEAILAHERGHQLQSRHKKLTRNLPPEWSEVSEEIVASLLGSLLVTGEKDQQDLLLKALFRDWKARFGIGPGGTFCHRTARAIGENTMMGPSKLRNIRDQVRKSFKMTDAALFAWFNGQLDALGQQPKANQIELDSLRLLRDALVKEVKRNKPKRATGSARAGQSRDVV